MNHEMMFMCAKAFDDHAPWMVVMIVFKITVAFSGHKEEGNVTCIGIFLCYALLEILFLLILFIFVFLFSFNFFRVEIWEMLSAIFFLNTH